MPGRAITSLASRTQYRTCGYTNHRAVLAASREPSLRGLQGPSLLDKVGDLLKSTSLNVNLACRLFTGYQKGIFVAMMNHQLSLLL